MSNSRTFLRTIFVSCYRQASGWLKKQINFWSKILKKEFCITLFYHRRLATLERRSSGKVRDKYPKHLKLWLLIVIVISVGVIAGSLWVVNAVTTCNNDFCMIDQGDSQTIFFGTDVYGVTNNNALGIFVPKKTQAEWDAFLAASGNLNISLTTACVLAGGTDVIVDNGGSYCMFDGQSCVSGWLEEVTKLNGNIVIVCEIDPLCIGVYCDIYCSGNIRKSNGFCVAGDCEYDTSENCARAYCSDNYTLQHSGSCTLDGCVYANQTTCSDNCVNGNCVIPYCQYTAELCDYYNPYCSNVCFFNHTYCTTSLDCPGTCSNGGSCSWPGNDACINMGSCSDDSSQCQWDLDCGLSYCTNGVGAYCPNCIIDGQCSISGLLCSGSCPDYETSVWTINGCSGTQYNSCCYLDFNDNCVSCYETYYYDCNVDVLVSQSCDGYSQGTCIDPRCVGYSVGTCNYESCGNYQACVYN